VYASKLCCFFNVELISYFYVALYVLLWESYFLVELIMHIFKLLSLIVVGNSYEL